MSRGRAAVARSSGHQSEKTRPEAAASGRGEPRVGVPRFLRPLRTKPGPGAPGDPSTGRAGRSGTAGYRAWVVLSDPPVLQRQEAPGSAPAPAGPRLTPPSLLRPPDPYARYMPDFGFELRMDPELQAMMMVRARLLLSPGSVLAGVASVAPRMTPRPTGESGSAPPPAGFVPPSPADVAASPPVGPVASPPGREATVPMSAPPAGPSAESVPSPDPDPTVPRRGSGGDVLGAVLATPQVARLVEGVQGTFTRDFSRYWEGAATGERALFVGSSVVVGGSVLAPLLGFEGPRDFTLSFLNDVVLPVPGVAGYGLEFRFGEHDVMVGAHLDVGVLLPSVWGFGPASFQPIKGPPGSDPNVIPPPVYPKEDGAGRRGGVPGLGSRIRAARGGGRPLPETPAFATGTGVEPPGPDFSEVGGVRVHTGGTADALARDVGAVAFTSGRDIFFRAGAYDPDSPSGSLLLAHELAHVEQQARGALPPLVPGSGVRMGAPGDTLEREADRRAGELSDPGPHVERRGP